MSQCRMDQITRGRGRSPGLSRANSAQLTGMDPPPVSLDTSRQMCLSLVRSLYSAAAKLLTLAGAEHWLVSFNLTVLL